ncbi:MAG: hypothetical protein JWN86_4766 [Planctomycetota bacterium]|nr:hypothetical protein [Planctomycetota bacterium]
MSGSTNPTSGRRSKKPRPNPFYILLILVSTLFAITVMGYLVGPFVERQALERPGAGPSPLSRALAAWFERKGVVALAMELVAMLVLGVLAMATDRYFSPPRTL